MRDDDNDAKLTAGKDDVSFFRSFLAVERGRGTRHALNRGGVTRDVDVLGHQCEEEEDALGKVRKLRRKRKRCRGKK